MTFSGWHFVLTSNIAVGGHSVLQTHISSFSQKIGLTFYGKGTFVANAYLIFTQSVNFL